jgi:hypothetical protein
MGFSLYELEMPSNNQLNYDVHHEESGPSLRLFIDFALSWTVSIRKYIIKYGYFTVMIVGIALCIGLIQSSYSDTIDCMASP